MTKTGAYEVLMTGLRFPEGPAFGPDGSLWVVELAGESLVCWLAGKTYKVRVGGKPNGIAIDRQGRIWFCDAGLNAIRRFTPETGKVETVVSELDGLPLNKPNDLAFDRLGNLVFTCPGNSRQQPTGYVAVRTSDGRVCKLAEGFYFPNGLAFDRSQHLLVVAETYSHRLLKGCWNTQTAAWTQVTPWVSIPGPQGPGGPDGLAYDERGWLYTAVYGTGCLQLISPEGKLEDTVYLPGNNPTNCAFDPFDRLGLVVTEAERGQILSFPRPMRGIIPVGE